MGDISLTASDHSTAASPTALRAIQRLESLLTAGAQRIAILAVTAILVMSLSTIVDIVMRTFFRVSIYGLNELLALLVAVAISTALPYGLAKGSVLSVDIVTARLPERLRDWLELVTPLLLALFFVLAGLRIWDMASVLQTTRQTTMITMTPKAPFFFVMAASFLAAALLQSVMFLRGLMTLLPRSGWGVRAVLLVGGALVVHALLMLFSVVPGGLYDAVLPASAAGVASLSFLLLWVLILLGLPIGACMGLIGLAGIATILGPRSTLVILGSEPASFITKDSLSVLPLFLLMGAFAGVGGIGKDLYALSNALVGHLRGGLAHASIIACALFGTLTGSSIATQLSVGKIGLHEMQERRYSPALSSGAIAAGGTLGQLIPPSSALILYAIMTEQSIGKLFVGAIIPGILATLMYMGTVTVWLWLRPQDAIKGERASLRVIAEATRAAWSVILLLALVLGGIYSGFFTELEAGAVGAFGAFTIALARGKLNPSRFWQAMGDSTHSLAMIYSLILGVVVLSFFFGISGVPQAFTEFVNGLGLSPLGIVLLLVACYLVLGTVMDPFAMMVVTIPFFVPLVTGLGYDPIWWGLMTIVCMEAGMISPPFGLNMFVIKSLDRSISIGTVYRGCWPFFGSTLVKIALLLAFPALVTWLPSTM